MNELCCCWRKLRNVWKPPLQHSLWPAVTLVSVWGEAAWKKRGTRRRTSANSPGNNAAPPSSPSLHLEALRTGSPAPSPSWWLWHFSWTGSWLPWFHWGRKKTRKNKERVINMQWRLSHSQGIMQDLPKWHISSELDILRGFVSCSRVLRSAD